MAPARIIVAEAQDASYTRLFRPRVVRALAAQLICAVALMHMKGHVHAGKLLKITSLWMTGLSESRSVHQSFPPQIAKSIELLSLGQLYQIFGSPVL